MLNYLKPKKPFHLNRIEKPKQIFDLLQLSRKEREYRTDCQRSIRALENWKRERQKIDNPSLKFYLQIEGILLRRRAQDAVLFYRLVRNDRIKAFNDYVEKLPMQKSVFCTAS